MTNFLRRFIGSNGTHFSNGVDIVLGIAIAFLCVLIAGTFSRGENPTGNSALVKPPIDANGARTARNIDFGSLRNASPFDFKSATTVNRRGKVPIAATKLDLKLSGVRLRENGLSSAIIKVADKPERSFVVGEQLMPNVNLRAIYIDFVQITHSGVAEQLYLDGVKPKKVNQQ